MPDSPALIADRYRLCRLLGYGGMGRVWLAHDEVLHRDVAVKEVIPPLGLTSEEQEELRLRTLREARTAARLSHPNVVRIYDTVHIDERPWIVMEYVPSRSLHQVVNSDGPLTPRRAAKVGLAVLSALRAAHDAGVLHRDIKPGNVLLAETGRVVLTDFGLATFDGGTESQQLTRTGLILGSPQYIAPERAKDGLSLPESDMWSLGATLFAAVEGRSPYARSSAMATLLALATEDPDPALNAGPLKPVLDALLRKDPKQRATIAQTDRLLRRALAVGGPTRRDPKKGDGKRVVGIDAERGEAKGADPNKAETRKIDSNKIDMKKRATRLLTPVVPSQPQPVVTAAATSGSGDSEAGSSAPKRSVRGRRRWMAPVWIVAAIVATAAAGVVSASVYEGRQRAPIERTSVGPSTGQGTGARSAQTTPSLPGSPTGSPSPSQSPGPSGTNPRAEPGEGSSEMPAGWYTYQDGTGFQVAAPRDWSVSYEGTMVYFRDFNSGRVFGVDQTDSPKPDPVADWTNQESQRAPNLPGYQRVKIEAVSYHLTAADWEYTHSSDGNPVHVVIRGFVTSPTKAYGIYWLTPEATWQDNYHLFTMICESFRPAP